MMQNRRDLDSACFLSGTQLKTSILDAWQYLDLYPENFASYNGLLEKIMQEPANSGTLTRAKSVDNL